MNNQLYPFFPIVNDAMANFWSREPHEFQGEAIARLLMMTCNPYHPTALLLVQSTGGGKSMVPMTVGSVTRGVTLIIENTQSLAADQVSKYNQANNSYGPIKAFHLDAIKTTDDIENLRKFIIELNNSTNVSIFIYSSPETLLKPAWTEIIDKIIAKKVLRLVCIDEVHQFVSFGSSFRPEFGDLRDTLFKKLIVHDGGHLVGNSVIPVGGSCLLKIPLIFMTATITNELVIYLQRFVGIRMFSQNYLWAGRERMKRRTVKIDLHVTTTPMKIICTVLENTLSHDLLKKAIVYTNTAAQAESIQNKIDLLLENEATFEGDTLLIIGDLETEVKQVNAERFTEEVTNADELIEDNEFYPRVLVATSSCIGAGLDSSLVYSVLRIGFPTSLINMIQEMGRCGRGRINDGSSPTDLFSLCIRLNDYVYLHERLFSNVTDEDINNISRIINFYEQRNKQQKDIDDVLKLIFGTSKCWHSVLENHCSNPLEPPSGVTSYCGGACPHCLGKRKDYIMNVRKDGLKSFLLCTFLGTNSNDKFPSYVLKQLKDFPNVGRVVYNRPKSGNPPESRYLESTILQLIACGILGLEINNEDGKGRLVLKYRIDDSMPCYMIDDYWNNMDIVATEDLV